MKRKRDDECVNSFSPDEKVVLELRGMDDQKETIILVAKDGTEVSFTAKAIEAHSVEIQMHIWSVGFNNKISTKVESGTI